MAHVVKPLDSFSSYRDSRSAESYEVQQARLHTSTTLYVGNLNFYTTEEQVLELFGRVGPVKRVIMGLDRHEKTPCGFCFVEYYSHEDALDCLRYISGSKLDERIVRADIDPGFKEGRQYGRGKSGGQVRDEYRQDWDPGRGGYGHIKAMEEHQMALYREDHDRMGARDVPVGDNDDDDWGRGRRRDDDNW